MAYQVITNPNLNVYVSTSMSSGGGERRFQKDLTIASLKGKLEMITGGKSGTMTLDVFNKDDQLVCKLDNNDALLGSYPIDDGMRIHVLDTAIVVGEYEDVSKVEKFELSKDEYENRTDSVRAFKQRMKMGQFRDVDPEEQKRMEEEKLKKEQEEKAKAESIKVNERCEVKMEKEAARRGTVKFVGDVHFKPGCWVGVHYDEPLGKNDGSVQGKRYFECPAKYGGFVKPAFVTTGDYPELGLEDEDMEEI